MARLINIIWILLFVFQAFYQGLVYTYYVTNKAYIVEQLCENKDQPELKCDGKCHLHQLLQTTPEVDAKTSEPTPYLPTWEELKLPTLYCQAVPITTAYSSNVTLLEVVGTEWLGDAFAYQYDHNTTHWQPPRVASSTI